MDVAGKHKHLSAAAQTRVLIHKKTR